MAEVTLKLVVLRGGPGLKPEYPLNQQVITLGRSLNNLIVLQDSKVSRYHAEILKSDKDYIIKDLESANGIKVNGSRCVSKTLEPHDTVSIGETEFRVEMSVSRLEQLEIKDLDSNFNTGGLLNNPNELTAPAESGVRRLAIPTFGGGTVGDSLGSRAGAPGFLTEDESPTVGFPAFGGGALPAAPAGGLRSIQGPPPGPPRATGPVDPSSVSVPPSAQLLLENVKLTRGSGDVGGLEALVGWLAKRSKTYGGAGRNLGLPEASAITLVGGPGCGKSLITRHVAQQWNANLFRLNLPYLLFTPLEKWPAAVSEALGQVINYQPAILAIEDVDRLAERTETMGDDVRRAFKSVVEVLTHWLHNKGPSPFTVVTGTSPRLIHPEFLRKGGALDEVFYLDLPQNWERLQVFEVVLTRRNRDPRRFDLRTLVEITEGYSAAQIQEGVVNALFDGQAENREPTTEDLVASLQRLVPMLHSYRPYLEEVRQWALASARLGSYTLQEKRAAVGGPAVAPMAAAKKA